MQKEHRIILSEAVQEFIRANEFTDEAKLVLGSPTTFGIPTTLIARQISARRKAKDKLPTFYTSEQILFPSALNLEQCSSERSARIKSEWVLRQGVSSEAVVDLTAGFGIDSFAFSYVFKEVQYVERDPTLASIAQSNFQQLEIRNVIVNAGSAEEFVANAQRKYSLLYIDPSRRSTGGKVHAFQDCEPDVIKLLPDFRRISDALLIKASPMLDLRLAITQLQGVSRIAIVSIQNECKEVLFLLKHGDVSDDPEIDAINSFSDQIDIFTFRRSDERNAQVSFSGPSKYLFEPNASILKAGAFNLTASRFGLKKLHKNTHLYTGNHILPEFPGRVFEVLGEIKSSPASAHQSFSDRTANVLSRNYPLSPDELKRKLKLKDGGENYLIGTSSIEGKHLLAMRRIK